MGTNHPAIQELFEDEILLNDVAIGASHDICRALDSAAETFQPNHSKGQRDPFREVMDLTCLAAGA